jgi:hypothetical protein
VYLQGKATAIAGSDPESQLDGATATKEAELDLDNPDTGTEQDAKKEALSFNDANDPNEAIPSGESVYVSIQVDTRGKDTSDETSLSSELVVSANEAADPGGEA